MVSSLGRTLPSARSKAVALLLGFAVLLTPTVATASLPRTTLTPVVNPLEKIPAEGELSAVSCPATTFCVGVGSDGNGQPLSMSGNPVSWSLASATQIALGTTFGSSGYLDAIQCFSTISCVAVGSDGHQQPVILTGNPSTWTSSNMQEITLGENLSQGGTLTSISCVSATSCVIGGADNNSQPLVLVGTPGTFSASDVHEITLGPAFGTGGSLTDVVCFSTTSCDAVGADLKDEPLFVTGDPSTWTIANARKMTIPASDGFAGSFAALSCLSATSCVAVGADRDGQPLVVTGNPATWVVSHVAVVVLSSSVGARGVLRALWCASMSSCVAVGSSAANQPLVLTGSPTSWHASSGKALTQTNGGSLSALSCASALGCVTVGFGSNGIDRVPALVAGDPQLWTSSSLVKTDLTSTTFGISSTVGALSCVSASQCVVLGANDTYGPGENGSFGTSQPLIVSGPPGSFATAPATQILLGAPFGTGGTFTSISCITATSCVAIGNGFDLEPFVVSGNPATWTLSNFHRLIAPSTLGSSAGLNALTCRTAVNCVAVGSDGAGEPVVVTGNPATWTGASLRAIVLTSLFGSGGVLRAVDCSSGSSCVAVGSDDAGAHGSGEPLVVTGNPVQWTASFARQITLSTATFAGAGTLHSVACVSATSCVAVGETVSDVPLVFAGNPQTWKVSNAYVVSVPAGKTPGGLPASVTGALTSVSCADASLCAAVGADTNGRPLELYGNPSTWPHSSVTRPTLPSSFLDPTLADTTCSDAACYVAGSARQGIFISPL